MMLPEEWQAVCARFSTEGPDGRLLSVITGAESDTTLRELTIKLTRKCPLGKSHAHCPFCTLRGLSHPALSNFINHMDRPSVLSLFEIEHECRNSPVV